MYVRLKVTISLYLSPNSMARSWPTLTAVIVERHLTYHTACYAGCVKRVSEKTPVNYGHQIGSIERHPLVVSTLLQIIDSNEEYQVLTAISKSRSVKPHILNNNYIKISSAAFDYAKCPNDLSDVSYEKAKMRPGFSSNLNQQ